MVVQADTTLLAQIIKHSLGVDSYYSYRGGAA